MRKGSAGGKAYALIQKREAVHRYWSNPSYCKECGNVIVPKPNQKIPEVRIKQFCNHSCAAFFTNRAKPKNPKPLKTKKTRTRKLFLRTKEQVFTGGLNWQSARSNIQKTARLVFFRIYPKPSCYICGYDLHVDVAHIKPVSSFGATAKVYEINHISNLAGLCKNHHWELDNEYFCLVKQIEK